MKALLSFAWALPLLAATAPTDWTSVQTNAIARWKAENRAPEGVVWDARTHTVRFLAEATGVDVGAPVEFFAIGPLSDRAYESLLVTVASPAAIAAAFDRAGVPRGRAVDPFEARLWPCGEKVAVTVKPWGAAGDGRLDAFVKDARAQEEGAALAAPVVWTGGARDAAGAPLAATNAPCAVFALYGHGPSLLQLDGLFDQSSTYGRFGAARACAAGDLFEVTAAWDGRVRVADEVVALSATNAAARLAALKARARTRDVYARLAFDADVTVAQAAALAEAFAALDGRGVKMNGRAPGQFFFRAFLPDPAWRQREGRIFQPFEVHVAADGARTFVFCEEDWSGEGLDPVLRPRATPFKEWGELPALLARTGEQGAKVAVLFLFAPAATPVASLAPVIEAVGARVGTFYVFGEPAAPSRKQEEKRP